MNDLLSMWMMHLTQELFLEGDQAPVEVDVGEVRKVSRAMDILGSAGGDRHGHRILLWTLHWYCYVQL